MSSYSSASLSSYDPASSSSEYASHPSTPSTSPGTTPPSPSPLKQHRPSSWKTRSIEPFQAVAPPRTTTQRNRALTLDARPHGIGVDPGSLVGKQLTRVRRSRSHPCTTLQFSDGTTYQILVVGYDPHYRGLPKVLESDSPILNPRGSNGTADVRLTVSHATSITLSDKAFQVKQDSSTAKATACPQEDRWTQRHAAFALKFEEEQGWHCIWATMAEYDARDKERCVFRNYADVYLDKLHASAPSPTSAPAHVTSNPQFAAPPPPPSGNQKKGQKPKRKGGKNKSRGKARQ